MSGHKRATVALNQEDFRRLHEAEQRLRTVEHDYQDIKARAASIHSEELWQSFRQVEARQQHFQQALSDVDQDLSALEWNTSQALLAHLNQVQQQMGDLSGQLVDDTAAWMQASSQQLEAGLDQLALQHQDELAQLQRSLRKLHRSQQERAALAARSLADAQALFEALQSTYALPASARVLAQDLADAQANCQRGLFEAALVGAQQSISRLSDLRMKLEQELVRKEARLRSVRTQAQTLYETGLRSAQVPALDLDGQPLDFTVDVPFWSGGAFQAWSARCLALLRQLESQGEAIDTPDLERIELEQLPALHNALSDLVYQARLNVIASQVRFNIAACIVQALQEQGFELSEAQYDAADQRASYQATVRAFDGSEVVVHVHPVAGQAALTDIDLVSHDQQLRSEHELRQRARELALSLQAFGLQVGQLSVPLTAQAVRQPSTSYSVRQPAPLLAPGQGPDESPAPFTYPERPAQPHLARARRQP